MTSVRSRTRRPNAMAFSASTSSDSGRDPVVVASSREVVGQDLDEISPRSIREGKAGSGSAQGPPSQMAERDFSQSNGGVKTHLTNSCGTNHKTFNAKPWQEGSAQHPRSRGDVVCVRAQRFLFGTHHE